MRQDGQIGLGVALAEAAGRSGIFSPPYFFWRSSLGTDLQSAGLSAMAPPKNRAGSAAVSRNGGRLSDRQDFPDLGQQVHPLLVQLPGLGDVHLPEADAVARPGLGHLVQIR